MGCSTSTTAAVAPRSSNRCSLTDSILFSPRVQGAIEQFNNGSPGAAIERLGLAEEPVAAATFLHRTPALDTAILGEFLSEPKQETLMRSYVQWLDLSGLPLDAALRRLLRGFRLPGEAQKIDRMMDAFAKHWVQCQGKATTPGQLTADTAFVLSFALIMLNTDLHNPSVKRKMSLRQFQSNLRGLDDGQDLPSTFVSQLYENVMREEFCLNQRLTGSGKLVDLVVGRRKSAAIVPDLHIDTLTRLKSISSI